MATACMPQATIMFNATCLASDERYLEGIPADTSEERAAFEAEARK